MSYFHKRYHPPGTAPGTLIQHPQAGQPPLTLRLVDYTEQTHEERVLETAAESRTYLERDTMTWIHVQGGAEPDVLRELGHVFRLNQLALEDVINTGQRPKIDDFGDQLFIVMARPNIEPDSMRVVTDQVSLFLGRGFVISFYSGDSDPFGPVRDRLRDQTGRVRARGVDYLLYALIDIIIDEGFPVLEWLAEEIEVLEEEMLEKPTSESLKKLYQLKHTLLMIRRVFWPQRDVAKDLVSDGSRQLSDSTRVFFSDCYDHTMQIIDLVEIYRESLISMQDVYLSSVSFRLNETMRVLTVIATIFIPLTFVVGVYGMNFANADSPWAMPELQAYFGYPLVWLLMILIAGGMLLYFRRRDWF